MRPERAAALIHIRARARVMNFFFVSKGPFDGVCRGGTQDLHTYETSKTCITAAAAAAEGVDEKGHALFAVPPRTRQMFFAPRLYTYVRISS